MKHHISFDLEFKKNPYPGRFIAMEGIDGSGKTTQATTLTQILNKEGKKAIFTKEPTDGPIGKLVKQVITGKTEIPPVSFQYLFAADRQMHQQEIKKYLQDGTTVVADRYFWSGVAYGMVDREPADENDDNLLLVAQSILSMYHQFIVPDSTFYLKISTETAMARLKQMDKEKELYERQEILSKIANGYEFLAKTFPKEITVIDGEKSVDEVTKEILSHL